MVARKHDWPRIHDDYVEGVVVDGRLKWLRIEELAQRFGVNRRRIEERSAREGWVAQREAFQRRVEQQRQSERSAEIARVGADLDLEGVRAARDGMAIARARIQELGMQSQRRIMALQAQSDGSIPADQVHRALVENPPVDAQELERLSRSADNWYLLGTRAVGLGPRLQVDVQVTPVEQAAPDPQERDALTLELLGLMQQHVPELLPVGFGEVIDVGSHVHGPAGNGTRGNGTHVDAADQQLHPADVDDSEPEH